MKFPSSSLRQLGSYRLPTHRRGTHKKIISMIPSCFKIENLAIRVKMSTLEGKGLIYFLYLRINIFDQNNFKWSINLVKNEEKNTYY